MANRQLPPRSSRISVFVIYIFSFVQCAFHYNLIFSVSPTLKRTLFLRKMAQNINVDSVTHQLCKTCECLMSHTVCMCQSAEACVGSSYASVSHDNSLQHFYTCKNKLWQVCLLSIKEKIHYCTLNLTLFFKASSYRVPPLCVCLLKKLKSYRSLCH